MLGILLYISIFFRPPIPIDETRYLSVAWEMWLRGDFLVPYLNGKPYSHKPPLLFWLMQIGWSIFGVNEWWPRSIGMLAAFLNLYLTRYLAKKLWPSQPQIALYAPWLLMATLLWTLFATATMFDTLLTNCVLLGMLGLVISEQGQGKIGWALFVLAIALGFLTKGPVVLIHLLPTALLITFWGQRSIAYARWFGFCFFACLVGVGLVLIWAIPAAIDGGEDYGKAILWYQTVDRIVKTHIHVRPFWWYLEFALLLLFPWSFWLKLWQSVSAKKICADYGLKFCTIWLVSTFLVFSIISSKQLHYLIPVLPAFSLLAAALLNESRQKVSLLQELFVPIAFVLVGVLLVFLPHIAWFAKWYWVKKIRPLWGVSVAMIGLALFFFTYHKKQLSIVAASSATILAVFVSFVFFFQYNGAAHDLKPAAIRIKAWQDAQVPVVFVDNYQGQFNFLAKMTQPLAEISREAAQRWAMQHPNGYLIGLEKSFAKQAEYQQLHRENWLVFRTASQYLNQVK